MKKKLIAPIVVCFLLILGCQHKSEKYISEGRIEYSVKVLNGEGNMMAEMIPDKMIKAITSPVIFNAVMILI